MREPGENVVEYDQSLVYDYPSVGQIAQALREQDIIPIFAAEQSVREFYDVSSNVTFMECACLPFANVYLVFKCVYPLPSVFMLVFMFPKCGLFVFYQN